MRLRSRVSCHASFSPVAPPLQEAVNVVRANLHSEHHGARALAEAAFTRGSQDNISAMVVLLPAPHSKQ